MPDTDALYDRRAEATERLAALDRAKRDALYAIELIAADLRDKFPDVTVKDERHLIDHASDGLEDMLADEKAKLDDLYAEANDELAEVEHSDRLVRAW